MFVDVPLTLPLLIVTLIGILSGGVINALADDLPHRRPVSLPHYPDGTPRPFIAWLGITAYLFGKSKSPSGSKLHWRHPVTEITTAILMIVAVLSLTDNTEMHPLQFVFWLIYMMIFMLVTVIDLEHRLILFVVIIPSYVIALLDPILTTYGVSLLDSLGGAALGFGIFFALYLGGFFFTYIMSIVNKHEIDEVAFGYGDVMLIVLSGLILGWQALIFAMFITVFLGAFGAIIFLAARAILSKRYSMFTPLPYGQYIVIATILMLLFSVEIGRAIRGY